jgi:hypothetical protein
VSLSVIACKEKDRLKSDEEKSLPIFLTLETLDTLPPNYDDYDIKTLTSLLNTNTNLEEKHIGFTGKPSRSYLFYEQLVRVAPDTTLLKLTHHQNPKMRVYGMWGLITKNSKLAETQLNRFYYDRSTVTITSGCITMTLPIYDIATRDMDSVIIARHKSKVFKSIRISH